MQEMPPALGNVLIGVGASALTLLITLYVKDSARKVVEDSMVRAQADLKKDIDSALSKFREDFFRALDQTYRRTAECNLMMEQAGDFQDILEKRADSQEASIKDLHNSLRKGNGNE